MMNEIQEEAKLNAMQRVWQTKRGLSTSLFEDVVTNEEFLNLPTQATSSQQTVKNQFKPSSSSSSSYNKDEIEDDFWDYELQNVEVASEKATSLKLDGSTIRDIPAIYTICSLEPHQLPVIGVYIDRRIIPGFKYRVRPLPSIGQSSTLNKCLFNDRALYLNNIGRGFARRFTFEADENNLNNNDNYFYSDNRYEGYAFELEILSDGDKFTIFDLNKEVQGTVEVLKTEGSQTEISNTNIKRGIEKRANVRFTGKVEFFETGVAKHMPLNGLAVALKIKNTKYAIITKVINVIIKKQKYTLIAGIKKIHRRVTVRGKDIDDVPTKYTMTGLEPYEIPVVGTYVDPRIICGFYYKIRPNDRKEYLFNGRALKLINIGMGYAKRLTFQSDSFINPDNYLWSDNHPDGLGLEIRAIRKDMKFIIKAGEQILGKATVFRADRPQMEEKMEKIETQTKKFAIKKYIHIDVMCHITLIIPGGGTTNNDEHLMRVYGLAVVIKEPNKNDAKIIKVENVGLDSQLNLLFAQNKVELTFIPQD